MKHVACGVWCAIYLRRTRTFGSNFSREMKRKGLRCDENSLVCQDGKPEMQICQQGRVCPHLRVRTSWPAKACPITHCEQGRRKAMPDSCLSTMRRKWFSFPRVGAQLDTSDGYSQRNQPGHGLARTFVREHGRRRRQ